MIGARVTVHGEVQGVGLRDAVVVRALEVGALGWVRNGDDGEVLLQIEGSEEAVDGLIVFLGDGTTAATVDRIEVESTKPEGHEQFAIRGVGAGRFEVAEAGGFELRLEVDGAMRAWALPKEPSMDPAVKRMAFEVPEPGEGGDAWDGGIYEQGGRVPWPEAIDRGHAVFVLHGDKLEGGFALQRIRPGAKPQWLLIKRRDDFAR